MIPVWSVSKKERGDANCQVFPSPDDYLVIFSQSDAFNSCDKIWRDFVNSAIKLKTEQFGEINNCIADLKSFRSKALMSVDPGKGYEMAYSNALRAIDSRTADVESGRLYGGENLEVIKALHILDANAVLAMFLLNKPPIHAPKVYNLITAKPIERKKRNYFSDFKLSPRDFFPLSSILVFGLFVWLIIAVSLWSSSVCHAEKLSAPWTSQISFGTMSLFFNFCARQVFKLVLAPKDQSFVFQKSVIISLIGFLSTLLMWLQERRMCVDNLGVVLPLYLWVEWIVLLPLVGLSAICHTKDLSTLKLRDWLTVASLFISIVSGFLMTSNVARWGYWLCFGISTCFFFIACWLMLTVPNNSRSYVSTRKSEEERMAEENMFNENQWIKRIFVCCVLFPLPIIYIFGMFGFDSSFVYAAMAAYNFFGNAIFLESLTLVDVSNSHRTKFLIGEKANDDYRALMRSTLHEIRVPLNSAMLGLSVLTGNPSMDLRVGEGKDMLKVVTDSLNYMGDTLNDVLSMQTIEDGTMTLNMAPFSVKNTLDAVRGCLRGSLAEKDVKLEVRVLESVVDNLIGDKGRLIHVLATLAGTAIRFSPEHGGLVRIIVALDTGPPPGAVAGAAGEHSKGSTVVLKISVSDNGMGVSERDMQAMFTPFAQRQRGAAIDQEVTQTSGFGLALSRDVIRLHGGDLTCTSRFGVGSTFIARLPLEPAVSLASHAESVSYSWNRFDDRSVYVAPEAERVKNFELEPEEQPKSEVARELVKPLEYLIVDDSRSNWKMLDMFLRQRKVLTAVASDGSECLELVKAHPLHRFDMIFMDNNMPIMTGIEATKLLRELGYKNLIVGVTGSTHDSDVFVAAGADLVLTKPVRGAGLDTLLKFVAENGHKSDPKARLVVSNEAIKRRASML